MSHFKCSFCLKLKPTKAVDGKPGGVHKPDSHIYICDTCIKLARIMVHSNTPVTPPIWSV